MNTEYQRTFAKKKSVHTKAAFSLLEPRVADMRMFIIYVYRILTNVEVLNLLVYELILLFFQ